METLGESRPFVENRDYVRDRREALLGLDPGRWPHAIRTTSS